MQDYEVFPGEAITFHVLSMGQRKGGSPAEIAAFYVHDLVTNKLQPINAITRLQCSTVNYTVVANTNFENATPSALVCTSCTCGLQENAAINLFVTQTAEILWLIICFIIHFLCMTIE